MNFSFSCICSSPPESYFCSFNLSTIFSDSSSNYEAKKSSVSFKAESYYGDAAENLVFTQWKHHDNSFNSFTLLMNSTSKMKMKNKEELVLIIDDDEVNFSLISLTFLLIVIYVVMIRHSCRLLQIFPKLEGVPNMIRRIQIKRWFLDQSKRSKENLVKLLRNHQWCWHS